MEKYDVDIEDTIFSSKKWGDIPVRFIRPKGNKDKLPTIYYIHGAGWVFGSAKTHDKLVRELAVRTNSVLVFPEYTRYPEVNTQQQLNKIMMYCNS